MIRIAAALALALATTLAQAAGGDLDETIGVEGISPVLETLNDQNLVFARAADGKFIVVRNTPDSVIVMRRLANGDPDTTFGTAGQVTHGRAVPVGSPVPIVPLAVKRVLFQGTKILLAGEATSECGTPGIARLNANGSVDITFGFRGWSTPVPARFGIAGCNLGADMHLPEFRILANGRIMVVAMPYHVDARGVAQSDHIIVRWTANGEADTAYQAVGWQRGLARGREPGGARIFPDGSVQLVRSEPNSSGRIDTFAVYLDVNGASSQYLLATPADLQGEPLGAVVQDDRTFILFDRTPAGGTLALAKFRRGSNGTPSVETSFGTNGIARVNLGHPTIVRAALATPDGGTLFLVDSENAVIDGRNDAIVMLKIDMFGALEPSFSGDGRLDFSTSPLTEFPQQADIEADGYLALYAYTTFRSGGDARYGYYHARLQAVPDIVEFENTTLKHYFIGYDNAEARGIDRGAAGPGWVRTTQTFRPGGPIPVCRFYAPRPSSHFYTADPAECEFVKTDSNWTYEGLSFNATLPVDNFCPRNLRPVHRVYNNRFAQNDANHRFLVNESLIPSMTGTGWVYEGVVFCVPR